MGWIGVGCGVIEGNKTDDKGDGMGLCSGVVWCGMGCVWGVICGLFGRC